MVADSVVSFEEHFEVVEDPRIVGRTTHSLHTILFIVVAATIAGADGPEDMAKFANRKQNWLKRFVDPSVAKNMTFRSWLESLPTFAANDS